MLSAALLCATLQGCSEPPAPRSPSAADNVHVIAEPFHIDGLDRERTLRVYLPPGYADGDDRYPVLYMHDGQNLFDDATSYAGEWGVDETLNELAEAGKLQLIVVGIDNGELLRMNELSLWPNSEFGEAEGAQYLDFLVDTVKPWVDRSYRTLPEREHTGIMGSSMGGLISHAAVFRHPDVFSRIGIFSPSYWVSEQVYSDTDVAALPDGVRLYFLMGGEEGADAIENMTRMMDQLKGQGFPEAHMTGRVVPGAEHNEGFWRQEFPEAVTWLFSD